MGEDLELTAHILREISSEDAGVRGRVLTTPVLRKMLSDGTGLGLC